MERDEPVALGVLVSGRGTNLQAILDAVAGGKLNARIALVVCNHAGAQAVERARNTGVPVELFERSDYPTRAAQQQAIAEALDRASVELVVCAGWDRVLNPELIRRFMGRIINVHPSLLPAFGGGLHAIRDALEYGVKWTGCTVHFVTEEIDAGPVILQTPVEVHPDDTEETLAERIHREEHRLLLEAIALYAAGRLRVDGRKVAAG